MKMTIRCGVRPNHRKYAIKSATSRSNPTSERLEDLNFIMYEYINDNYMGMQIISDDGKGNYTVSWNQANVKVSFNLNAPGYVYTIDGEGPYEHSSYEYIAKDIESHIYSLQEGVEDDIYSAYYPNGEQVPDDSSDMNKYLDSMYGTDRDPDISNYSYEEKQNAVDYWFKKNDPRPKSGKGCINCSEDFEDYEDEIQQVDQEFTSENTSINSGKLPAVFNMVNFEPGTINLDFGGGRFDNVAEYLTQYDVINLVYDPYNRSKEHNREVIKTIRKAGGADTATCSNVLNVIKEPEARLNVLENIKKLVKPGGTVYITVYEGSGKGNEGPTKSGYQLNRKTADYVEEIQQVFPEARRKGKLITAINASTNIQSAAVVSSEDDAYENELSVEGFYDMFVPYLDPDTMEKAAYILYEWYSAEGEEYMPDRSDVLDMCDAADDEGDKKLVLFALGEIGEDELDSIDSAKHINSGSVVSSVSMNDLEGKLKSKLFEVMTSPNFGFPEEEVDEYSGLSTKYNEDGYLQVTVWAEVSYEGMEDIKDALDPIIQSVDSNSYFDMECPGRMIAIIEPEYIQSATNLALEADNLYDEYMKLKIGGTDFEVYYTSVDTSPESDPHDIWEQFKAQLIVMVRKNRSKYAWAQIENGAITFIKNGKIIDQFTYADPYTLDMENDEWCDSVIYDAADRLNEINSGIKLSSIHSSSDTIESGVKLDEFEDSIEVRLDAEVLVDEEGDWQWADSESAWAFNPDSNSGDWFSHEYDVYLDDPSGITEKVEELILEGVPAEHGLYHVTGDVELVYDVSGVTDSREYYSEDEGYESNIDIDDASSQWNRDKSSVKNLQFN